MKPIARRLAEQFTEVSLDERHAEARKRRRVSLCPQDDGMADLIAHLPASEAYAIYDRLTRMSRTLEGPGASPETQVEAKFEAKPAQRSRDEVRADILTDLILRGIPSEEFAAAADVRAQVQLVVHESVLRDELSPSHGGFPPALDGYGPIDTDSARWLLGAADFWDVVTVRQGTAQQETAQQGTARQDATEILSVDRYRPSGQMRRLLRVRDQRCRFPGCQVPASRCDIDHTIDAALGGPTATDNLAHLCRGHHILKHNSGWQVTQRKEGELTWISPTGRVRMSSPPSRVMFAAAVPAIDEPF
nr:HNH endonuclease signature motif containing protein [Leucobacter viscericola]